MRAVIYARFSTELQSAASIEDQACLCRERATALGLSVVAVALGLRHEPSTSL
jgi:DNA invertase Pin-like site-specific DNA recombinase